jgi:hypothetical protein
LALALLRDALEAVYEAVELHGGGPGTSATPWAKGAGSGGGGAV